MSPPISPFPTKVCALCGAPLDGLRPDARFCGASCRVEARRISAILSPSNSEPYRSLAERLSAAQTAYKPPLVSSEDRLREVASRWIPQTAIGRLLSGDAGGQSRKSGARRTIANDQLRLPV